MSKFITASDWITLDIYLEFNFKNPLKENQIKTNIVEEINFYKSLVKLDNLYSKNIFYKDFQNFLAYIYQCLTVFSLIRYKVINELETDFQTKLLEYNLLYEDLLKLSSIENLAKIKNYKAFGSASIELGFSSSKDFATNRLYILLKIYLENIYDTIIEFIIENSVLKDNKENLQLLLNNRITKKILANLLKEKSINKNLILDSLMGNELLTLAFALADKNVKNSIYSFIFLKEPNEELEKFLFPLYENIDNKIKEYLFEIGFNKNIVEEIISFLKFSDRKIC